MTTRTQRDFLKVQLLETQRLQEMACDHPLMSVAFAHREREIETELAALPLGAKEPRTVLFFSGEPVVGSLGIDASFAGRVLEPFQSMVMADFADRWHGTVGSRGRRAGEGESRLLLTALPRGSFGLELSRAPDDQLFGEDQLADTLSHVTRLVEAAARSDEDFATALDEAAPRVVQNLRDFLAVVAKGHAGLRLESGDFRCTMTPVEAKAAYDRVAGTITKEDAVDIPGIFKGVLLGSWKFDFVTDENHSIGGAIDENLTEEQVIALNLKFFNGRCLASLLKTTVQFKNGRMRTTYVLKDLASLPSA